MKTALILGGSSDIGVATAKKFAREGFEIILAGPDPDYLDRISKDISIRENATVRYLNFNAIEFDSHKDFYWSLHTRPDVCVCVFGYMGDQRNAEKDWPEAERIIDINYKGAVSILNIIAQDFSHMGGGTIVGVSSVAGDRGRQSNFIYGSAKAAFTAYLSGLRNRFYKDVHVATIKPGFVDTKMTESLDLPPMLTASPEQAANAVYEAYVKKRDVVYVLSIWRLIMLMIRNVPEFMFKRLKL